MTGLHFVPRKPVPVMSGPPTILQEAELLLAELHESEDYEFILAIKPPTGQLRILHTPFVSPSQRLQIEGILENRHPVSATTTPSSIVKIRPALRNTRDLVICTKNDVNTVKSTRRIVAQYQLLAHSLSQLVCKNIAKEWIRVVEPKKQSIFPYKNFNASKPPWWPHDVNHIEPDHLEKYGRVQLLVSILRNPQIDLLSLKRRTDSALSTKPHVLRVLDELYYVAVYDRILVCGSSAQQKKLVCLLSSHEKQIILTKNVAVRVSQLLVKNVPLMVSKMTPEMVNTSAFDLTPAEEQAANERSPFDHMTDYDDRLSRTKRRRVETLLQQPTSIHEGEGPEEPVASEPISSSRLTYQLHPFSQRPQERTPETTMASAPGPDLETTTPHPIQDEQQTQAFASHPFVSQPYLAMDRGEALHRRHSSPLILGTAHPDDSAHTIYDENTHSDPESPYAGFLNAFGG